jgi:hypothetical protein
VSFNRFTKSPKMNLITNQHQIWYHFYKVQSAIVELIKIVKGLSDKPTRLSLNTSLLSIVYYFLSYFFNFIDSVKRKPKQTNKNKLLYLILICCFRIIMACVLTCFANPNQH